MKYGRYEQLLAGIGAYGCGPETTCCSRTQVSASSHVPDVRNPHGAPTLGRFANPEKTRLRLCDRVQIAAVVAQTVDSYFESVGLQVAEVAIVDRGTPRNEAATRSKAVVSSGRGSGVQRLAFGLFDVVGQDGRPAVTLGPRGDSQDQPPRTPAGQTVCGLRCWVRHHAAVARPGSASSQLAACSAAECEVSFQQPAADIEPHSLERVEGREWPRRLECGMDSAPSGCGIRSLGPALAQWPGITRVLALVSTRKTVDVGFANPYVDASWRPIPR
jgi:hypothetical protein